MGVAAVQPETPEEFQEELSGFSSERIKHLAEVAKHDLYVMSRGVLGYEDVNPATHKAFCNYLQEDEPERKRRMALMPRIHLKSTIATIANNIRGAVKRPDFYRGLIIGETETKAVDFLREIKAHWVNNETLKILYPELVPEKLSGPGSDWAYTRASLNRGKAVFKEATWTALGAGGAAVGGHWTRIFCDDIIGLAAMLSEADMLAAKKFIDNIDSLTTNPLADIIDFIGTRWSRGDVYAYIMELYGSRLSMFRREAIENGLPIFPAKHSLESLAQIQKRPVVWFAQYCNNPLAQGQTDFPQGSVHSFTFDSQGRVSYSKNGRRVTWELDALDIVLLCDPNGGGRTAEADAAIVVTGITPDDDILVLQTWSGKPTPSEFVDKIFDLHLRWRPRAVGIEQAGQLSTIHYFERKAREEGRWPNVITLKPKNRNKIERIRTALEPILASHRLYCLPSQTELRGQIEFFPDTELYDLVDALAYGTEEGMWRKPDSYEEQEENGRALRLIVNRRSVRTGY